MPAVRTVDKNGIRLATGRTSCKGEIQGLQPGETPNQAIKRLTREMHELQEANYILRKALGFVAGR